MNNPASITSRIRAEARRLGFFAMGVAGAGPLPWRRHFADWLARGMHGEMAYLDRQAERRSHPSLVMDDVRSILVLAVNYYPGPAPREGRLQGKISRYARGADYHQLMAERLQALLGYIAADCPGTRGMWYADTGPVMEKVWGAHTALGWMGKHSNLITTEAGSWFFLGVILLDLELPAESRHQDRCGTCSRCITACPTGAIVAPYVVDARLCISYLTIELRGAIPRHLRPSIGNRIFGCDDCQEVCPWNRFAVPSPEPAFRAGPGAVSPELVELAAITPAEFHARYRHSAIRRAHRDGLVRNVAVALGNSGSPAAVPALAGALRDASPLVRAHAAWGLGRIHAAGAEAELGRAAREESDPAVQEEIRLALSDLRRRSGLRTGD